MKPYFRKIFMVILGLAGVFLVLTTLTFGWEAWKSYKWQKSVEKWEESLRKPYKEDIFGGATPEETWAMFLDALRAGNIELASRYYDVEHQEKAKEWLQKLKESGKLKQTIKEMEELQRVKYTGENEWLNNRTDRAEYSYDFFDEEYQQKLAGQVNFYLNPLTKVWKILW